MGNTGSRVWQWRTFVWPLWAERLTIFIELTRMAWRIAHESAVVQRVMPGQLPSEVVSLSLRTSKVDPTVMNPEYTLTPWSAKMSMTRDCADITHHSDGYRRYMQLPTGRCYVVAVGDVRDIKRVTDGA